MGWSFAINKQHSKRNEVDRLVAWQKSDDAVWPLVDHRLVGDRLWMVVKHHETGEISPALYLLQSGYPDMGWGHKLVNYMEYVDMPLSLLSMLPPGDSPEKSEWRELVRKHHGEIAEKRQRVRNIAVGDMFVWGGGRIVVQQPLPDGQQFTVAHEILRKGEWVQCKQYRAKRTELASLPPFKAPEPTAPVPAEQTALFA